MALDGLGRDEQSLSHLLVAGSCAGHPRDAQLAWGQRLDSRLPGTPRSLACGLKLLTRTPLKRQRTTWMPSSSPRPQRTAAAYQLPLAAQMGAKIDEGAGKLKHAGASLQLGDRLVEQPLAIGRWCRHRNRMECHADAPRNPCSPSGIEVLVGQAMRLLWLLQASACAARAPRDDVGSILRADHLAAPSPQARRCSIARLLWPSAW